MTGFSDHCEVTYLRFTSELRVKDKKPIFSVCVSVQATLQAWAARLGRRAAVRSLCARHPLSEAPSTHLFRPLAWSAATPCAPALQSRSVSRSIYVNRLALVTSTCGVRELGKLAELTVTPLGQILQAWCSNFLSCAHLPEFFGGTCRKGSQDIVETLL